MKHEEKPVMESLNPIQPIVEQAQQSKREAEVSTIMDEWFNGAPESR